MKQSNKQKYNQSIKISCRQEKDEKKFKIFNLYMVGMLKKTYINGFHLKMETHLWQIKLFFNFKNKP